MQEDESDESDEDSDEDEAMEEDEEDQEVDQNFRLELMKVLQKQNALVGVQFSTSCLHVSLSAKYLRKCWADFSEAQQLITFSVSMNQHGCCSWSTLANMELAITPSL